MKEKTTVLLETGEYRKGEKLVLHSAGKPTLWWADLLLFGGTLFPGLAVSTLADMGLFSWSGWMLFFYLFVPYGLAHVVICMFHLEKWKRLTIEGSTVRIERGRGYFSGIVSSVDHSLAGCDVLRGRIVARRTSEVELVFLKGEEPIFHLHFPFEGMISSVDLFEFLSPVAEILDLPLWRTVPGVDPTLEFGRDPWHFYRREDAKLPVEERMEEIPGKRESLVPAGSNWKASVERPDRLVFRSRLFQEFGWVSFVVFVLFPSILAAPFAIHTALLVEGSVSAAGLKSILSLVQGLSCLAAGLFLAKIYWIRDVTLDLDSRKGRVGIGSKKIPFEDVNGVLLRSSDCRFRAGEAAYLFLRTGRNVVPVFDHRGEGSLEALLPLAGEIARRTGRPLLVKKGGEIDIGMNAFQAMEGDAEPVDLLALADEKERDEPVEEAGEGEVCPHCSRVGEHRFSQGGRGKNSYWVCISCGCSFDFPASLGVGGGA